MVIMPFVAISYLKGNKRSPDRRPRPSISDTGLVDKPIRFDIEAQIARLLDQRMKMQATDAERRLAGSVEPALKLRPFQIANGSLRYYVRAEWNSGKETGAHDPYVFGAWMAPLPKLHILAVEKRSVDLLNVVDLGAGRAGIMVEVEGDDSRELDLADYRDGASTESMQVLHSIGVGE